MVGFSIVRRINDGSLGVSDQTATSSQEPLNQPEPINAQEQVNLELPESTGDEEGLADLPDGDDYSGVDYATSGPGDPSVAGIDYAENSIEQEGSYDSEFLEDEYGSGGEDINLDSSFQGQSTAPKKARKNPLNDYSTYSYGLSLAYMTIKEYNDVVARGRPWSPSKGQVLIASGGRRGPDFSRNRHFELDLYITDLKMTTVIGINSNNKGTNAIDVTFTVHEPLGASFLENLVTVAQEAGIKMWDQMPLVLQIDFFAINPDGSYAPNPIPNLTKYLCVKIIDIKISITQKGAEYKVRAIPQSHSALQSKSVSIPVNFEITAKTVQEFFKSTGSSDLRFDLPPYDNQAKTIANATRDENKTEADTRRLGNSASPKPNTYGSLSLSDALNEYQKELAKKGYQGVADEYVFVIDPEIERANIFVADFHNLTQAPIQNDKTKKDELNKSSGVIPINAGSSLIEVINNVIRSSDYYRSKINPPSNEMESQNETNSKNQPLTLHKVLTTVEYLDQWDNKRKIYKKKITFNIVKFSYHNQQYPNAKKSIPSVMDKEYNYIFMGKNQEIIDLKIEFNTLFFQSLTAFEGKTSQDNIDTANEYAFAEGIDPSAVRASAIGSNQSASGTGGIQTLRIETAPVNRSHNQLNDGSKKSVQAVDLFNSIFNKPGGDMISIDIEIAGDPDLIKQDDVWLPPGASTNTDSLLMDRKQLFISLNFKIPRDINLSSGLYEFESKNSAFSGIYNIVTVENSFNNGAFKQRLKCVRLFDQPADNQNKRVSRESSNLNRSVVNPVLGSEDSELQISSNKTIQDIADNDQTAVNEELVRANSQDSSQSTAEEERSLSDFELANYQQWPESFAVTQQDIPLGT